MKLTVCGSITFYGEMENLKTDLETRGHEVLIPLLALDAPEANGDRKIHFGTYIEQHGGMDAFPPDHVIWTRKEGAIKDHFQKIEWSDAVVIANYDKRGIQGYIGGNTLIEIGIAFYLKKPIYILNPISSELTYRQEIYGMKPVLLNGDLERIG